jgi:hypothetical protein
MIVRLARPTFGLIRAGIVGTQHYMVFGHNVMAEGFDQMSSPRIRCTA